MLKIIFLFLQLKISFSYPKKNKILVIDKIYSDLFKKLISKNLEVISIRYENLNFFVLLNLLFSKRKKNFFNYILIYIELINPSLIITGNDNLIWFYKLKKIIQIKNLFLCKMDSGTNFFLTTLGRKKIFLQTISLLSIRHSQIFIRNLLEQKLK